MITDYTACGPEEPPPLRDLDATAAVPRERVILDQRLIARARFRFELTVAMTCEASECTYEGGVLIDWGVACNKPLLRLWFKFMKAVLIRIPPKQTSAQDYAIVREMILIGCSGPYLSVDCLNDPRELLGV